MLWLECLQHMNQRAVSTQGTSSRKPLYRKCPGDDLQMCVCDLYLCTVVPLSHTSVQEYLAPLCMRWLLAILAQKTGDKFSVCFCFVVKFPNLLIIGTISTVRTSLGCEYMSCYKMFLFTNRFWLGKFKEVKRKEVLLKFQNFRECFSIS